MPTKTNGPRHVRKQMRIRTTPMNLEVQSQLRQMQAHFMTTEQAGRELGLEQTTIRKYCSDGCFSNTKVFGNDWLVSRYDVDWWKENRKGKRGRPRLDE